MALMDKAELAEFLGVPKTWVRDAITARSVPITWVGRHARFDLADVEAWLAENKERPAVQPTRAEPTTPPPLGLVQLGHPPAGPRPTPPPPPRPMRGRAA